jgi:hypothetical protein
MLGFVFLGYAPSILFYYLAGEDYVKKIEIVNN